jgi:capsular polysaccharide biosynthesis protein
VVVTSRPEGALEWLRKGAWRLSGPFARKHSGYFFIWTRAILARLDQFARRRPLAVGIDSVSIEELGPRVVGAAYRELESAAGAMIPPPGWVWPSAFPPARRESASTRCQGVFEIPGGVVFGTRGAFGPDPRGLLADTCSLWSDHERRLLAEAAAALAVGLEELDGVTMNLGPGVGSNYSHCLLQSVPRLGLLRRAFGLEADRFLLHDAAPRPMVEALAILGIPADRLYPVPSLDAPAYRCEMLRAATSLATDEVGVPWAAAFLNELFLPHPPDSHAHRIYVRRGVQRRAVLNEDEVLAVLELAGFEAVTMDGRSIAEQAAMFAGAEVIVASHGAALANLVFSRPGTAVIELMGRNTASAMYPRLAWRRGLRYHMIMGTEPAPPEAWWSWQFQADTVVDVPALEKVLDGLGLR